MVQEMFKGQEIETSFKTINIRTFNSPNKSIKNKNQIINFSSIENNRIENNRKEYYYNNIYNAHENNFFIKSNNIKTN